MKSVEQTRRDFLRMAGKGVLGAAALTAVPSMLTTVKAEAETGAPAYPWTYQQVDKEAVKKHTYECFYSHGGCCAAVVSGILETMAEKYGYPYNQIPGYMFGNGAGGYGAATLCGSLDGACAVIGLFFEVKEARAIRDELFDWYRGESFPKYQPEMESITTIANSIQCSDSVGTYMAATGYAMSDPGRLARCAGLSADVAEKTIELMNIHLGLEAAPAVEEPEEEALADNEYIGVGNSEIGGDLKVKVTMDGDKIAKIEVLEHNETSGLSDPAFAQIPDAIIASQSTEVDTVSGATKTSEALIAAVNDALSQVKK